MSKDDWILAYERNLDDGMSEEEAIEKAQERAADIAARKADDAYDRWRDRLESDR